MTRYEARRLHPYQVKVGDYLPARTLFGQPQEVTAVEFHDTMVTITVRDGWSTTVPWEGELRFPRRENGVTYDWRTNYPSHPPLVTQLVPGDYLPASNGNLAPAEPQMVTGITGFVRRGSWFVQLRTWSPYGPLQWVFHPSERAVFPRTQNGYVLGGQSDTARRVAIGKPNWFGPYLHEETRTLWEFTYHPHGRGRWPADIRPFASDVSPVYDPETEQPFTPERAIAAHREGTVPPEINGGRPTPYGCRRARWPEDNWDDCLTPLLDHLPVGKVKHRRGPRPRPWY